MYDYAREGQKSVGGALQAGPLSIVYSVLDAQDQGNIRGNIAEIGVSAGKTFMFLCMALRENERAIAVDPFEVPEFGVGDFQAEFEGNLARFGVDRSYVDIYRTRTENLDLNSFADRYPGNVRFFHVDGGHRRDYVMRDLDIAARTTSPDAVIAIDDFFHYWFPDVTEGVLDWLKANRDDFVALALAAADGPLRTGCGKLFICRRAVKPFYLSAFARMNKENLKGHNWLVGEQFPLFDFSNGVRKTVSL
jgi:hypothetical protein